MVFRRISGIWRSTKANTGIRNNSQPFNKSRETSSVSNWLHSYRPLLNRGLSFGFGHAEADTTLYVMALKFPINTILIFILRPIGTAKCWPYHVLQTHNSAIYFGDGDLG
jgi:hypothetical protein